MPCRTGIGGYGRATDLTDIMQERRRRKLKSDWERAARDCEWVREQRRSRRPRVVKCGVKDCSIADWHSSPNHVGSGVTDR